MKWYQKKIKFQNKEIILTILVVCFSVISNAQEFDISGELRPRFESRHGFGTLSSPDDEAANFISQRARINLKYTSEKYEVFFAMQNVRVWGDVSTLASSDKNGTTFHQAWAQYNFSPKFSIKIGRQEIDLDDQRIFGSVGWAQQARSHDALLLKFKTGEKGKLDIGLALNANGETLFKEEYEINQYKSLQYAWYHTNINDALGLSFLFLNNGLTYNNLNDEGDNNQETTYSQTIGGRLTYGKNRFDFNLAGYYQGGNTPNSVKDNKMELSAYYFTVNGKFKFRK